MSVKSREPFFRVCLLIAMAGCSFHDLDAYRERARIKDGDVDDGRDDSDGSDASDDSHASDGSVGQDGSDGDARTNDSQNSSLSECEPKHRQQCGDDGNVYWFDSCDNQGEIAEACPRANSECVSLGDVSAECSCLGNWDRQYDCQSCKYHWQDNQDNCGTCPDNWDPDKFCNVCLTGWEGDDCERRCIRYVDIDAPEGGDGSSWAQAFRTVQEGIDAADEATKVAGTCEVWVAEGVYYIYKNTAANTVLLQPNVSLYGGFGGDENSRDDRSWTDHVTTLDGHRSAGSTEQVCHVVTGGNDAVIDGFTITGGNANDAIDEQPEGVGGGMYNAQSISPVVRNCTFVDNEATAGGAMGNDYGASPIVTNCAFVRNSARGSGAISAFGELTITNSVFIGNSASSDGAGAIYVDSSTSSTITDCVFIGNSVTQDGGALVAAGVFTVKNCFFIDNLASVAGGAICIGEQSRTTIINNVFVGNWAERGGAISTANDSSTALTNCTVVGNRVNGLGGGIYGDTSNTITVTNSILWDNQPEQIYDTSSSAIVNYSNVLGGYEGDNNKNEDPGFVGNPLATNSWSANPTYQALRYQTVMTDDDADWTGDLADRFIRTISQESGDISWAYVVGNTDTTINVWGDLTDSISSGDTYDIYDLHLQSDSTCIDAADDTVAPDTDIEGNRRVDVSDTGRDDTSADMGAFEYQFPGRT